jgi:hypothetical protein
VRTDHKKLTYAKSTSDRVMRWRLLIQEFGPELKHIQRRHNLIADALSRLEIVNTSVKAGAKIPKLPLGDSS